jgi:hypothetical protein
MRPAKSRWMKICLGLAAGAFATLASTPGSARQVRTTFSFVVSIDDRVWPYNDDATDDVTVLLPQGSPWRCVRRKLVLPGDGAARGTIECSPDSGRTKVSVSAACGLDDEEQHNTATLAGGGAIITVGANCRTSVYGAAPAVTFPTFEWPGF